MTELRLHCATLVVMSSIRGLCVGKRKTGNSWYLIVVEDMADEKYDVVIGDPLQQRRSGDIDNTVDNFGHKRQADYRPTLLKRLPTDVTNHIRYA